MLLYSGHEEETSPHTPEVALKLSKEARNAFMWWESHGCRIIKSSLETKKEGITVNVIQCYAPTNNIDDDRLQSIVEKCSVEDLAILM
ncbi:unnamed protein product [Schistosoma margrebowiei]|uniref:Uncharacterized protein n=1 Tax=Schistosoma margrebowiei TaxID=48269 RepID=A0A183ME95_9TREM|nr:unnamed protein product [Schistosoma margrebowiei]